MGCSRLRDSSVTVPAEESNLLCNCYLKRSTRLLLSGGPLYIAIPKFSVKSRTAVHVASSRTSALAPCAASQHVFNLSPKGRNRKKRERERKKDRETERQRERERERGRERQNKRETERERERELRRGRGKGRERDRERW